MSLRLLAAAIALSLLGAPALAQSRPSQVLEKHLTQGTISAGESELAGLAATRDPEAAFAHGMIRFAGAVERFSQQMHRYGLRAPRSMMMSGIMFPVPPNPKPEQITYEAFREALAGFVRDLDAAKAALEPVGDAPVKIAVDLMNIRLDLDRDGKATDEEKFHTLFTRPMGVPGVSIRRAPSQPPADASFTVAFDAADAYWLRGYCNLMSTFAEFFLAHDFRETFNQSFDALFPGLNPELVRATDERRSVTMMPGESGIADYIAMLHLVRWNVAEPQRLTSIHSRLKEIIALNRKTWAAARAETDNDREWLPNPKQTGVLVNFPVNDETIEGWLGVLGQVEAMLDGKLLVPHWRFERGINLRRVLLEPRPFDLVLWVTGHGAAPYLETGPLGSGEAWQRATMAFRGNFLSYAFFFN